MSAAGGEREALDCLRRGVASALANWQLAPLLLLQTVLTAALMAGGFLPLLALLGGGVVGRIRAAGSAWPERLADELATSLASPPELSAAWVLPIVTAALVWSLGFLVYCYLQGGLLGTLVSAESQAGSGKPAAAAFRSFSVTHFDRRARGLFWRYFWLNHLIGAVLLGWLLLLTLTLAAAVWLGEGVAPAAGVTLGCSSLVPLGLLLAAVALWSLLATVAAARPASGVLDAGRAALGALRRRPGAVLLLSLLAFVAWVAVGAFFLPLGWGIDLATGDAWLPWIGARGLLMALESLADSWLAVALQAALVALLAGERPAPAEAEVA